MRCIYMGLISILRASCGGSNNNGSDATSAEVNSPVANDSAGDVNVEQAGDPETNTPQTDDSHSTTSQLVTNSDSWALNFSKMNQQA